MISEPSNATSPHGGATPGGPGLIHVVVYAPRSPNPKTFTWAATLKVGDAARQAAEAFGYSGGNLGLQTETQPPRVLDNSKTLGEEKIDSGDKLELIDTGGGVQE